VAQDLVAHAGAAAVVVGDGQPPEVHALGHAMNALLASAGRRAVTYAPSPIFDAGEASQGAAAMAGLARAIDAGEVATLIAIGGDPAYTAPADVDLARRLRAVPTALFVGSHVNETARACAWFAPEAHYLEAWGDARAFDGTASIVQPLIRPLRPGKTAAQVLERACARSGGVLGAFARARRRRGDRVASRRRAGRLGPHRARPRRAARAAGGLRLDARDRLLRRREGL
jgi:molybdopterin-containing oxidoreductase family iron-sulfur binding subunit